MGRGSSRRDGLPAVGWVGMARAAGTVGTVVTPEPTLTVRAPVDSGARSVSADAAACAAARRAPYRRCTACLVTPSAEPTASHEKPRERSKSTAAVTRVSTLSRSSWARRTVGAGARP